MSPLATLQIVSLLLCSVLCLHSTRAHPTAYVSALFGNDSSDCSQCSPCKTIGKAMQTVWGSSKRKMFVNLYQGSYPLEAQFDDIVLPASIESEFSVSGDSFPSHCNVSSTTSGFGVSLSGSWDMTRFSRKLSVSFSNLEWDSSMLRNTPMLTTAEANSVAWVNCSILCGTDTQVILINREHQCQLTVSRSVVQGPAWTILGLPDVGSQFPLNVVFEDSLFETNNTVDLRYHPISSMTVLGSTLKNDLHLIGLNSLSMNCSTMVSSLVQSDARLIQSSLFHNLIQDSYFNLFSSYNGLSLFRFNQFEQSAAKTDPRRQVFVGSGCHLDLQANWFGDSTGPHSCCNIASNGLFTMIGNIEVWCTNPNCTSLSGPINQFSGVCYREPACQTDIFCSPGIHASIITAVAFVCSCLVLVALSAIVLHIRTRIQGQEETSLLNSTPDLLQPQHKRIQVIIAAVSILIDVMVIFAAWVPCKLSPPRPTEASLALIPWAVNLAILLSAVASIRIFSNLWLLILMLRGGRYRSLFANIIFSALAMLLCMFWRLSSTLNAYDVAQLDPDGKSQLAALTENTTYYWILFSTHLVAVVVLGIPSLMMSLKIITVRDYSEVEKIKEDIFHLSESTAGESLLHTGVFFKVCRVLSYICLFLMVVFISMAVVFLLLGSGPVSGPTVPTVLISVTFMLAASGFMYFYGFVYLRWRFYEMSRGWLFVAISLAIALSALEFTVVYSMKEANEANNPGNEEISPEQQNVNRALLAIPVTLLSVLVATALTMSVLLRKMRSRLAPSVVENVYDRLERTFGE